MKRYIVSNSKSNQLDVVTKYNPVYDNYHTWIRNEDDIHTFEEVWEGQVDDDFTDEMAEEAMRTGEITVYSSYPIKPGIFVSPSYMEAEAYSNGHVYSRVVKLDDIAWIDATQGQYAPEAEKIDNPDSYVRTLFIDAMDYIYSQYEDEELGEVDEASAVNIWKDHISEQFLCNSTFKKNEPETYDDMMNLSDSYIDELGHELASDYEWSI